MWKVKITDEAAQVLESGQLSVDDRIVIQKWAETVAKHGPNELLRRPSVWRDHALYDNWRGYRASSFSHKGRIIYRIENRVITVVIVRITPDHNYKK